MAFATLMNRRQLLKSGAATAAALVASGVMAQDVVDPAPFSFDILSDMAQAQAAAPFVAGSRPEGFLGALDYDDYRLIRFRADHARWADSDARFHVHAFHTGWLFGEPVKLFELTRDADSLIAAPMVFSTADFEYLNDLADRVPADAQLPGVAGFRLNTPLNKNIEVSGAIPSSATSARKNRRAVTSISVVSPGRMTKR